MSCSRLVEADEIVLSPVRHRPSIKGREGGARRPYHHRQDTPSTTRILKDARLKNSPCSRKGNRLQHQTYHGADGFLIRDVQRMTRTNIRIRNHVRTGSLSRMGWQPTPPAVPLLECRRSRRAGSQKLPSLDQAQDALLLHPGDVHVPELTLKDAQSIMPLPLSRLPEWADASPATYCFLTFCHVKDRQ